MIYFIRQQTSLNFNNQVCAWILNWGRNPAFSQEKALIGPSTHVTLNAGDHKQMDKFLMYVWD